MCYDMIWYGTFRGRSRLMRGWRSTVEIFVFWNLEFDETVPLTNIPVNWGPLKAFLSQTHLDEASKRIPPTSQRRHGFSSTDCQSLAGVSVLADGEGSRGGHAEGHRGRRGRQGRRASETAEAAKATGAAETAKATGAAEAGGAAEVAQGGRRHTEGRCRRRRRRLTHSSERIWFTYGCILHFWSDSILHHLLITEDRIRWSMTNLLIYTSERI